MGKCLPLLEGIKSGLLYKSLPLLGSINVSKYEKKCVVTEGYNDTENLALELLF
jgi:hypothetical protein